MCSDQPCTRSHYQVGSPCSGDTKVLGAILEEAVAKLRLILLFSVLLNGFSLKSGASHSLLDDPDFVILNWRSQTKEIWEGGVVVTRFRGLRGLAGADP